MAIRFTFQDSLQQGLQRTQRRNEVQQQEARLSRQQSDLEQFRAAQIHDQQTARRLQEESNQETVRRNKQVAADARARDTFENELIDVSHSLREIGLGDDIEGNVRIPRRAVSAYFTAAANTFSAKLRQDAASAKAAAGTTTTQKNRPYGSLPDSRFEEDFFRLGVMQIMQQGKVGSIESPTTGQVSTTAKILNDFYTEGGHRPEALARVKRRLNVFQTGAGLRENFPPSIDAESRPSSNGFYDEIRRLRKEGVLTDPEAHDMIQQFVQEGRVDPLEALINQ